jgi:ribosome assembly protein 4
MESKRNKGRDTNSLANKQKSLNKKIDLARKAKNLYKTVDNYDKNVKKVKNEIIVNKNKIAKKEEINQSSLDKEMDYPSQIVTKLVSIQGEELGSELTIPIQTNILDLNVMMNKLKKVEETQSYVFLIDNIEIKNNILDTIKKIPNFNSETVLKIIYRPESLFSVKPLSRASSTMEGHTDSILAVQYSPDGKQLASGGGDCTVRFWDTDTETPLFDSISLENNEEPVASHSNWVLCLSFSPCGTMLASGAVDGVFIVWNPNTGLPLTRAIKAHSKWITSLAWKPLHLDEDCKYMLTTSKDGYLKIWNVKTGHCHLSVGAHEDSITKAIWSGENFIYTCSQDKLIKVWDEKGIPVQILKGHAHWINTMTINTEFILRTGCYDSADSANNDKKIQFYNDPINRTGENRALMHQHANRRYKAFKEKINASEKIVTGSDDFTLILWDPLNSDKPVSRMTGHQGLVNHVCFSPDTFYLASASFDKSIKVWNGHTGVFLFNLRGHVGPVYQIAWSPDSRMLLSGSKDTTLKCWNIKVKRLMHELPGHADEVYCVDWSPDGEKAVSGSKDRRLRIWKN